MIKYWTTEFKDKYKTAFVAEKINDDITENYIVAKSMVVGMGLSWSSQYLKIKKSLGYCVKEIPIYQGLKIKACLLNKNYVSDYIDSIQISRVADTAKKRIVEYREGFIDFIEKEAYNENMQIFDSYIDNGIHGIQKLLRDTAKMNYLSGYNQIAVILNELMNNDELTLSELVLSNKIHDIADYLSKNQFRLKG